MAQVLIFNFSELAEANQIELLFILQISSMTQVLFKAHHLGWV